MQTTILRKTLLSALALALTLWTLVSCLAPATQAFADTEVSLDELQKQVDQAITEYDEAQSKAELLDKQIKETEEKITELEKSLPSQQAKSNDATVALYKMRQEGYSLISVVLTAGSLEEFISSIEFIERIQKNNFEAINRLISMKSELETAKAALNKVRIEIDAEKSNAVEALKKAETKRDEAQQKALEEAQAVEAAAKAAVEATQQEQQEQQQSQTDPSPSTPSDDPGDAASDINWPADKASFVEEWSSRINNYLAGSPLAGQGRNFAEAAWDYNVDPRWSPAISNTESTKGTYCFLPYNAWGWGHSSWGSWEEAIRAHAGGLSRGYGYTISEEGAKRYCPGNWQHWYSATLAQMNMM